ncbi:hypothetical protein IMSHALPRED_010790 [Imshaugia aleurites]|uniref:Uncharacterized protein n=1 Tax=Imshaugia aleurites TaxID=172621 RepID=A0A8H3G5G1_9LECA|nr:hypothetical protein IMSHALPRED_010790 [Imshaugia aleurites]
MFDLMGLPAELRIKIYEYALVRDVVRIVSTAHPLGAVRPPWTGSNHHFEVYYGEPNPQKSVTLRTRSLTWKNIRFVAGRMIGDPTWWSYGIQPDGHPPLVNIFLTSREVYSETWPIFYQQNAFAFTHPLQDTEAAENCLSFLYDRPYHAFRHIRELHLLIGRGPQTALRSTLEFEEWQRLLSDLGRYMSVRVLVLYIRARVCDHPNRNWSEVPWKEVLYQITGLQELHYDIISESTTEELIAFVKQMRSKMVVGGEHMGTDDFKLGRRSMPNIEFTAKHPCNSLITKSGLTDMEGYYCY